jgi:hypothetical protein
MIMVSLGVSNMCSGLGRVIGEGSEKGSFWPQVLPGGWGEKGCLCARFNLVSDEPQRVSGWSAYWADEGYLFAIVTLKASSFPLLCSRARCRTQLRRSVARSHHNVRNLVRQRSQAKGWILTRVEPTRMVCEAGDMHTHRCARFSLQKVAIMVGQFTL